jgi:FKBP12-rapamycin complex-associated protein
MAQVRTLGQVVESTGTVVVPYMEYPQLLGMLLGMLSEGAAPVRKVVINRKEIIKVSSKWCYCCTCHMSPFWG